LHIGVVNPLVLKRADPWILLHTDGWYYFTASVPEYDRVEIRKARTISELATACPVVVWRKHLLGETAANIWAPELHFIDGAWYIYFAAGSTFSPFDVRLYVLQNKSVDPTQGRWSEKGRLRTNWDSISLDATTFSNDDVRYLVWAQGGPENRMDGRMDLYIARMSNPWTITGQQVQISSADRPWELRERHTIEGPAVLRRNGKIFITYSANHVDATYCMGMLSTFDDADLLNPSAWTKSEQPVFDSNPEASIWGPGHNSFTTSSDGQIDYLVYHARSSYRVRSPAILDSNRDTRVQPFSWSSDGTPEFGRPQP
jgi:GH43 family beta-xylosidase